MIANVEQAITDQEFVLFQQLIYKIAGIALSDAKRILLVGRLSRRLKACGFATFSQYYRMLASEAHPDELQTMVDLLTTNETYFFREPQHFEFLRQQIIPNHKGSGPFRVWSAASSSGEEAYSIAMTLAEHGPASWEVFASDISTRVIAKARSGLYSLDRIEGIPPNCLKKYCLKGVREQAGRLLVSPEIRQRVNFAQINLTRPIDGIGEFDVIFLRNVMIYFDMPTKRKVIDNMLPRLKPNGYFIVGHSESLNGITQKLTPARPTIYRWPGAERTGGS